MAKKVALVFDGIGWGGIERVGIDYTQLFLELGYSVTLYNLKPNLNEMEKEYPKDCEIKHIHYPTLLLPAIYFSAIRKYWWGKYLYPFAHLGSTVLMYLFRLFMGRRKEYDLVVAFSGHFRDLTFVAHNFIKGKKKLCWLHGALLEYLVSSNAFISLYKKIHNLIVLSEQRQVTALHENPFLEPYLNIKKLYNPIHLEQKPIDEKFCHSLNEKYGKYLLMVGRFGRDKDQKTVIKARKILEDEYGDTPFLVFVGNGDTLDECKEYAAELGFHDEIVFMGARSDVQNFYASAFLKVHSSPAEGLPTVILEALKYGLPIVATDSPPGVTEILQSDYFGLRCEVGNPEDMALKIHMMLSDAKMRNEYTERGKECLERFSYATIKKELIKILEELV